MRRPPRTCSPAPPIDRESLGDAYAGVELRESHMTRYDVHVVPHGDQWAVIREGDDAPVSLHAARAEAAHAGRLLAEDGNVGLAIHPREGEGDSYQDDPRSDD